MLLTVLMFLSLVLTSVGLVALWIWSMKQGDE